MDEKSFRGSRQRDYRVEGNLPLIAAEGRPLDVVRRRALTVLRSSSEGAELSESDLAGPIWALIDTSHGNERVKAACSWFQLAAGYREDEDMRRSFCIEAYSWIERALRCFL